MDFGRSDEQKMLEETVRAFAEKQSPLARMRKLRGEAPGFDRAVWRQMGELGWLAMPFPEAAGGLGGSFEDAAIVIEGLARTLVPEPYVASVVLAGTALHAGGGAADHAKWLSPMLAGDTVLALAFDEPGLRGQVADTRLRAEAGAAAGATLHGEKVWVEGGAGADAFVVSAREGGALALFVVDAKAEGVHVTPVKTLDGRFAANVVFSGAAAERLGASGEGAENALRAALDAGAAAAAVEGAAISARMLEMTVEYLRTRTQFGVKIGSFQALQHRAVDMFVEVQLGQSAAMFAAHAVRRAEEARGGAGAKEAAEHRARTVSVAKAELAEGGRFVAEQAIQLHGGIGVTDEHDIGLFFKRMVARNLSFGDRAFHLARIAAAPAFTAGV